MEKFDFDSKKYVLLLVVVCLVFFILIVKAFDYLPDTENDKTISRQNVTLDSNYNVAASEYKYDEANSSTTQQPEQKSGSFTLNESTISNEEPIKSDTKTGTPILEEIKAPSGVGLEPIEEPDTIEQVSEKKSEPELSPQEKAEEALMMGDKMRKANNLSSAFKEYQKVPDLTNDKEVEKFSNFRKVPGTTNVYRSWHPYKVKTHKFSDKTKYVRATEPKREEMIIGLYEKYGIKTDICLSENETTNMETFPVGT